MNHIPEHVAYDSNGSIPRRASAYRTTTTTEPQASPHRAGFSSGIHPEDRPYLTDEQRAGFSTAPTRRMVPDVDTQDDGQYNPYTNALRMAVSSRRYAPIAPRTAIRVTHHQPPSRRRASTLTEQEQQQTVRPPQAHHAPRCTGWSMWDLACS
jgi:hypothetical protein